MEKNLKNRDNYDSYDDEINLKDILNILLSRKKTIASITLCSALLSIIIALSLPNIYKSQSLLAPSTEQDSLSSKLESFSSLGSLAGFSLPDAPASKTKEAIARIESFEFFNKYFLPNIKLENLMAVKAWNYQNNSLIYKEKLFNSNLNQWVRKVSYPKKIKPSPQEAYISYRKILSINENNKTSFVSISIEHQSPIIAKKWLDLIIEQINKSMRIVAKEQSSKSISYLNEISTTTNIQSIQEVISSLLEKEIQKNMLTSSNEYYVFKPIDSPLAPELKSRPSRALICIAITLLGMIFSFILIFLQRLNKDVRFY